jgi:hypothetical protein
MRSVIVDFARARKAERRGGEAEHLVPNTASRQQLAGPENEALRVREALDLLAQAEARASPAADIKSIRKAIESTRLAHVRASFAGEGGNP